MDALEALAMIRREIDNETVEEPAPGFLTTQQWAKAWGTARPTASAILRDGIRAGVIEMEDFKIHTGGILRRIPHYRAVPK